MTLHPSGHLDRRPSAGVQLLRSIVTVGMILTAASPVRAQSSAHTTHGNVVLRWNTALLQAVRTTGFAPPFTARALAIVHTCMYDAWAA